MDTVQKIEFKEHLQKIQQLHFYHTQDKVQLLNAIRDEFGDKVFQIIEEVEGEKAFKEWQQIAIKGENREIKDLIELLWEPLRSKGFEFTYEVKENGIQMHCTKCPIYELAKALHAEEWLYYHTCQTDPYIAEGFNSNIKLERKKTLMQGDSYCDHFYYKQE